MQCIQDEVNFIASNQTSNTITSKPDLLSIKRTMNEVLEGQASDRARFEQLAVSLENLITRQRSSTSKK